MKTLIFEIDIYSDPKTIWHQLWEIENYKAWTSIFCEGSYYKIDKFQQGSRIHLLTPSGEGMYSQLETVRINEFLAFKHIGLLHNFEEMPLDEYSNTWTNAIESYEIIQKEDLHCGLLVRVDTVESYIDYMSNSFPKALDVLKNRCETIK